MKKITKIALIISIVITIVAIIAIGILYFTKKQSEDARVGQQTQQTIAQLPISIQQSTPLSQDVDTQLTNPTENTITDQQLQEDPSRIYESIINDPTLSEDEKALIIETGEEEDPLFLYGIQNWGETNSAYYTLDRVEPETDQDLQLELELLLHATIPYIIGNNPSEEPLATIQTIFDFLTPTYAEKLYDNPPIFSHNVDATLTDMRLTKQDEETYTAIIETSLRNYSILDVNDETGEWIVDELGKQRKNYKVELKKISKHWYINNVNEQ